MSMLSSDRGTYAVLLRLDHRTRFAAVGPFGPVVLVPGVYVYLGSAHGSGGVRGRVGHHLRHSARPLWHLDYVRPAMEVVEVWATYDPLKRECEWARAAHEALSGHPLVPGMGSADCDTCPAHFFYRPRLPSFALFRRSLQHVCPDHAAIGRYTAADLDLPCAHRSGDARHARAGADPGSKRPGKQDGKGRARTVA